MREEDLVVKEKRFRNYSSYQGEISLAVPNVLERNFHADEPNRKWLTDITGFAIPAGKATCLKFWTALMVCCLTGQLALAQRLIW